MSTVNTVSVVENRNTVSVSNTTPSITVTQPANTTVSVSTPYVKTGSDQVIFQAFTDGSNTAIPENSTDTFTFTGTAPVTATVNAGNDSLTIAVANATTSASGVMSSADKTKLDTVASGAEVNVNADWNASSGDAQIQNKPTIPSGNQIIDWTASSAGAIHVSNLPVVALTTVQEASSQSAQLALTTQEGDVVVRTDENKSYVRNSGSAGSMSDFTLLRTPTDAVLSVNGNTGAITLTHDGFGDFVANEHIDWTTDQGSTNIHANNYTNTTYSVQDGQLSENNFTDADHTKLNGIATGAEVNVQADWNQTTSSDDSFIQNKPTFGIANNNAVKIDSTSVADNEFAYFTANGLESLSSSQARVVIDAISQSAFNNLNGQLDTHVANVSNPHSVTKAQVGLSNVLNVAQATLDDAVAMSIALG